ncbi:MAG TPA: type II toxin-antitoxin system VapC family toxin [Bryobacteraceae bacterium]|jgi:ribonuclease VapC
MIVVDSSALIAILSNEEDAIHYATVISEADSLLISAATFLETSIIMLNRYGVKSIRKVNALIEEAGFQIEDVTVRQAQLAIDAYTHYGKGRKSTSGLNYGDCFSYALAKATGLPLLFKGRDFSGTDVEPALH